MTTSVHATTPDTASQNVRFSARTLLCALALAASSAVADDPENFWKGPAGGDWNTPANWNVGVPADTRSAIFYNAATVTVSTAATMKRFDSSRSLADDILIQGNGSVTGVDGSLSRNNGTGRVIWDVDFHGNGTALDDGQTVLGHNVFKRNVEMYGNALAVETNRNLVGSMTFDGATVHTDDAIYAHKGSSLVITGDSQVVAKRFSIKENATVDFASGSILLTAQGNSLAPNPIYEISNRQLLAANGGTRLETLVRDGAAFDPFTYDRSAWTLNGGTLIATNHDNNASGGIMATNANFRHVISGSGTIAVYQLHMRNAESGFMRLDGPDLYFRRLIARENDL